MPEDYYSSTSLPRRGSGPSLRVVFGAVMLSFLGGAALLGWLVWDGRIDLRSAAGAPQQVASKDFAAQPSPVSATVAGQAAAATAGFEARVAALEARLARLDLESAAAEGNTARAEAMMVAFAARRAIERGAPLGFLSEQLKLRFGDAQPSAVATVLDAAKAPVTLEKLASDLEAAGPVLSQAPKNEGGWDRISRELSGLFVIRRDSTPSTRPQDRLERAKLLLRTGQTEAAIEEVTRLPGGSAAGAWIASAQRYGEVQRALDQLETAALLEPERLRSASGAEVHQPSPAAAGPTAAAEGSF